MSVIKHVIGSFGDIGAEIVKEAAKVPGDITGKALESMGTPSGKTQQGANQPVQRTPSEGEKVLDTVMKTTDEQGKRAISRKALEELVGYGKPKKEPGDWEKKQQELSEKKKAEETRRKQQEQQALPNISSKRRRGNLYGLAAKKAGSEISKNVKAE